MKRLINYSIFILLFMFVFTINVFAECSYQERKDLLNDAKLVDITVSPKIEVIETTGTTSFSEEPVTLTYEKYSFDFIISNLSEDLYIRYYNDFNEGENFISFSDLNDGLYRFNDNDASNLITYAFEIRSNNNNCAGQVFYTKKVIKPIYNYYSEYSICKEDEVKDKDYCKKFINKKLDLSESEFVEKSNKDMEEKVEKVQNNDFNFVKILQDYWFYFVLFIILIVIIVIVILIQKKRRRLV